MNKDKDGAITEMLAAQTILQRGVKFKIAAPFFIRWLKKSVTITVTAPYYGTLLRISAYYLSTGLKDEKLDQLSVEESLQIMAVHGTTIAKAVACAMLNGNWSGRLFTKPLAWYLKWHCKPAELLALTSALLVYGGSADFMSTTRLVRSLKVTTPNLGQTPQGS
ncbi:hypothetical protein [Croceivirga sp. JEA036]|uniref:hypothetical protein n=1 Tax=Croceivirga sp. JEA036 TaxID=2721162 RepID=UPI00143AF74D|nr:hypothetical protein [Croceivirga sp. JEA036]NJB36390.1 hypothetical protein [Croceivirga sp. JEA036]